MPAYSFKERFVSFVEDGTKPHTIRNYRKYPVKRGDTLYLYYGLRTRYARKLRQEPCTDVQTIAIADNGNVAIIDRSQLSKKEISQLKQWIIQPKIYFKDDLFCGIPANVLTLYERDQLAWKDGFRPEGSTIENSVGCFILMLRYWRQMHDLPFVGNLIHWKPKK